MFYSQCLLSRKGPLGGIWVAAYSFKKLKKAQVNQTDISSSVDKILQDEWDAVAYRVLAYLLLGVVRIYSKKVEYLFNDCNEVLIKIKKFVVSTQKEADAGPLCAPFYSVTLPDRFELDAFDLGALEIGDSSGGNVVSHEDITLKDCAKGNGNGEFSSDRYNYEEFGSYDTNCAADYTPVKDVLSSHFLDFGMDWRTSSNGATSEATIEKLQDNRFSQEECADLTIFEIQALPQNQVKSYGEDCETNGEQIKTPIVVPCDDVNQGEAILEKLRDSSQLQEGLNLETFYGTAREPSYHVKSSTEDHQIDPEEVMGPELVHLGNLITSEADRERQQSCPNPQEEYMDLDLFHGVKQPRQLVCSIGEESHNDGKPDKVDDQIEAQDHPDPLSVANAGTPNATVPSGLGVTTPKLMVIRTPAIRESARISRKRKCVLDDKTVLPNEVVKQRIHDASDLVSKRRKVPQNALAAWRSCRFRNLPNDFLEPLLPADVSQELGSLLCERKLKILQPAKTVRRPEKLDISKSPSLGRSERIEIAPETPVLRSQSVRSFDSPKTPEGPDMDIRLEPSRRMMEELSPSRGQAGPSGVEQVPLPDREQTGPSGSVEQVPLPESEQAGPSGTFEDVPFLDTHQEDDLNLLNEELDFCEGATPQLGGWSGRSRVVARYLHRRFPNSNGPGTEQVKLFQVSEGRTKKESARLLYEILVLKTKGYVDVKQDVAYGDILISKLPKWDQTWGDDVVNNATSETMWSCA